MISNKEIIPQNFKQNFNSNEMAKVTKIQNVDVDAVEFSAPRQNKNNAGKTIYVNQASAPLRIQTPKLHCPFGVSCWDEKGNAGGPKKYHLELSFHNVEGIVQEKFKSLEEQLLEYANENSVEIFGKKMSMDVIVEFFTSSLKPNPFQEPDPDYKYATRVKCKLNVNDKGEFLVDVYNGAKVNGQVNHERVPMTESNYDQVIPKGSEVRAIMSCSGWNVNKKFGLTWRIEQLQVFANSHKLNGFSFTADEEDSDDGGNKGVFSDDE